MGCASLKPAGAMSTTFGLRCAQRAAAYRRCRGRENRHLRLGFWPALCSNLGMSKIRFTSFPRTQPPPHFTESVVDVFRANEGAICTLTLEKGLTSDVCL